MVLLPLTACGSSDEGDATDANAAACAAFATANNSLVALTYNGKGSMSVVQWQNAKDAAVNDIDKASLAATGAVRERLDQLVADLPTDTLDLGQLNTDSGQALVTNEGRVENACTAEGHNVKIDRLRLFTLGR
ncbi:hypothetical protein [Rhodococcus aerolatus]